MVLRAFIAALFPLLLVSVSRAEAPLTAPRIMEFTKVVPFDSNYAGNTRVEFTDSQACLEPKHQCFEIKVAPPGICGETNWLGTDDASAQPNGQTIFVSLGDVSRALNPNNPRNPGCNVMAPLPGARVYFQLTVKDHVRLFVGQGDHY